MTQPSTPQIPLEDPTGANEIFGRNALLLQVEAEAWPVHLYPDFQPQTLMPDPPYFQHQIRSREIKSLDATSLSEPQFPTLKTSNLPPPKLA